LLFRSGFIITISAIGVAAPSHNALFSSPVSHRVGLVDSRLLRMSSLQIYCVGFPVFATSPFSCSTFRGLCNSIIYRQLLNLIDWLSQNGCRVYCSRRYWRRDSTWTCYTFASLFLPLDPCQQHTSTRSSGTCINVERHPLSLWSGCHGIPCQLGKAYSVVFCLYSSACLNTSIPRSEPPTRPASSVRALRGFEFDLTP
jgi:hypothetical protein